MMAKMQVFSLLFVIISLKLVSSAELQENPKEPRTRKRSSTDPVSNFISGLGDFFLDVDKAMAVQTAPKVEHESSLASQILGPLQPRRDYFDRIQQNYRNVQTRIGSLIADVISANRNGARKTEGLRKVASTDGHDSIKGRSLGSGSFISMNRPREIFKGNPFVDQVTPSSTDKHNAIKGGSSVSHAPSSHQHSKARPTILDSEEQIKKALEKVIADTQRTSELLLGSRTLNDLPLFQRNRNAVQTGVEGNSVGGIIGDVLNSESKLDEYVRQLVKDHGTWVLENPLLQRWRGPIKALDGNTAEETSPLPPTEATEGETSSTTEYYSTTEEISTEASTEPEQTESENAASRQDSFEKRSESGPLMDANYYRIDQDGSVMDEVDIVLGPEEIEDEEIDIALSPESNPEIDEVEAEEIEENSEENTDEMEEPRETVILAFTPDGIPLKLRMGSEIVNPINYLHKVLQAADVTLKVPVESYEDLEPVGKEVLLLGSQSRLITRAVYLDLSNTNELKSLLRTLMRSKNN